MLDETAPLAGVDLEGRAADAGFSELWGRAMPEPLICSFLKPNR